MRSDRHSTPTLLAPPSLPRRMLRRIMGGSLDVPTFSVKVPDIELRRSGHMASGAGESARTREEFRGIKKFLLANVESGNSPGGRNPNVILVASARPGEGKTFVALGLALSLAIDRDLGVTLIDGDGVDQGLSRKLGLANTRGLLDALDSSMGDVVSVSQDSNVSNLDIIAAGRSRSDSVELLSSGRMARLLDSLTGSGRLVVLDSRSLLSGSSASALASYAGQVAYVIASGETSRSLADEGLTVLDSHIGPLETANIGLVLNKINPAQSNARFSANSG